MDRTRVGVIGYGYWGPNLVRNFAEIPESELVAVADLCEDRLAHVRSRYPAVQTTRDYHDLYTMGLDAAVVATPPATHFQIARDCLEQGLHTLVEKPLTLASADAQELVDLAQDRDLRLMVGHTFEYNPAVRALKKIIESGELGQVYYVNSVRASLGLFQADLDVVWDLAPHDLSILRYILDADPISVRAQGAASVFEGKHDIAYLNLLYPGNILAHVHVSWLDPCKVRRITVVGSNKMVVYDDVETLEKIKIYDKGVERLQYTETFGEFQCSYRYGDVVIPNIPFTEPLRVECQHFLDSITQHMEPQSCGQVGLRVVKTLEVATRSLHNGGMQETMYS
jgi:predicted dehydrogenase